MKKEYYCCICHKQIQRNIRLVKQKWGKRFTNIANYDFCNKCILVFEKWLIKHNGGANE